MVYNQIDFDIHQIIKQNRETINLFNRKKIAKGQKLVDSVCFFKSRKFNFIRFFLDISKA